MAIAVLISVFAHDLTAFPGANWYAKRILEQKSFPNSRSQKMSVEEIPVRLPWRK